jgi:hypothetical protein
MKRLLKSGEKDFIFAMLDKINRKDYLSKIFDLVYVNEANDGGMGGLTFFIENNSDFDRSFREVLVSVEFYDIDKIKVIATLNLDNKNQLYELDIFKVDFSPLSHPLDNSYRIERILD